MRAFVVTALRGDLATASLMESPLPAPGPGEVQVRVRAAGLSYVDILRAQGKHQHKPQPPYTPGMELAGDVSALGEGVSTFRVGDPVWGGAPHGALADYAVTSADNLAPLPPSMTYEQGASFYGAYLTAYVALSVRGRLQAEETLLVHGAAGGSGLAAVDLGRILGARIIATASTEEKRAFLRSYGVEHALPSSGFRDAVKELTGGRGADLIFDPVGGDVFDESVRCIAHGGRLLVIGFMSGRIPTLAANIALIKGFDMVGVRAGEYGRQFPSRGREIRDAVRALAQSGKPRVHIGAVFPLSQTREAFDVLMNRKAIGKIVVRPDLG